MKPSSSPSDGALWRNSSATARVTAVLTDGSYLQALLDTEAALARAEAQVGLISPAHADAIAAVCRAERFDIGQLAEAGAGAGNPVLPLVEQLRHAVGPEAGVSVHLGATSQDIIDTASMLVAHQALTAIAADVDAAVDAAARLAEAHRDTVMAGRTLLQQALPTTFGAKCAAWLAGLDDAADLLISVRQRRLAVQLGGGAGTLAAIHPHGRQVAALMAAELGLNAPDLPWHTNRSRIGVLAGALGVTAGALAKPARDVTLLAQTEIAEVQEGVPGRGRSSAMPHKRNPVAAVTALAHTIQAPGLVATILTAASGHEHERAAGGWHAEWLPLRELFTAVGSAAAWLADCLTHLEVDAGRMRANVGAEIEKVLEPPDYLASTGQLITAALRRHTDRSTA
jgi:3-carboxy-cis,cis-muconate cycloisomerase